MLVVAGAEGGAEAAAGVQSKALTPAQRAMAATKRWVRLTSPLRCAGYCMASAVQATVWPATADAVKTLCILYSACNHHCHWFATHSS